jgi:hypothetical protein
MIFPVEAKESKNVPSCRPSDRLADLRTQIRRTPESRGPSGPRAEELHETLYGSSPLRLTSSLA